jgi:hypothetical protein
MFLFYFIVLFRAQHSAGVFVSMSIIIYGVVTTSLSQQNGTVGSASVIALCVISAMSIPIRNVLTKSLTEARKLTAGYVDMPDPPHMFFLIACQGSVLIGTCYVLARLWVLIDGDDADSVWVSAFSPVLWGSINHALYNSFSFAFLAAVGSALTHSVANVFKRVFSILVSIAYFGELLTRDMSTGLVITFWGLLAFSYFNENKADKAPPSKASKTSFPRTFADAKLWLSKLSLQSLLIGCALVGLALQSSHMIPPNTSKFFYPLGSFAFPRQFHSPSDAEVRALVFHPHHPFFLEVLALETELARTPADQRPSVQFLHRIAHKLDNMGDWWCAPINYVPVLAALANRGEHYDIRYVEWYYDVVFPTLPISLTHTLSPSERPSREPVFIIGGGGLIMSQWELGESKPDAALFKSLALWTPPYVSSLPRFCAQRDCIAWGIGLNENNVELESTDGSVTAEFVQVAFK